MALRLGMLAALGVALLCACSLARGVEGTGRGGLGFRDEHGDERRERKLCVKGDPHFVGADSSHFDFSGTHATCSNTTATFAMA